MITNNDITPRIIEFFKNNPNPSDKKVHAFAQKLGINEHKFEELIYRLMTSYVQGGLGELRFLKLHLLPWYVFAGSAGSLLLYRWAKGRGLVRPPQAVIPSAIPSSLRRASPEVSLALHAAADETGLPVELLRAVALVESGFNPSAISRAGAMGLMQLMPATARSMGVSDPYDPRQSALGGARFLKNLHERFGNWTQALAAYNWGPARVRRNPKYQQWPATVQRYISAVRRHWGVTT